MPPACDQEPERVMSSRQKLILAAAFLMAASVQAQSSPSGEIWTPRRADGARLTVMDALRLTLAHQPGIALAEQDVALASGYLLEQQGAFDTVFGGVVDFTYSQSELSPRALQGERDKRKTIREVAQRYGERVDQLNARIFALSTYDPDSFDFETDDPYLLSIQNSIQTFNALILSADDEEKRAAIQAIRDAFIAAQLAQLRGQRDEFAELERDQLDQLRKVGAVPTLVDDFAGSIELSLLFPLRSGLTLQPFFRLDGSGTRFVGKDLSFDRGGPGRLDSYNSELGFNVNLPLGRGGGWESTTALERAAGIDLEASRDAFVHSASVNVVETLLAYWDVVAAQQRIAAATESLRLQTEITDVTRQLVEGDELPRSELPRADASLSGGRASLTGVEQGLRESRVRLARVIGLEIRELEEAPIAVTDFPAVPDASTIESLPESRLVAAARTKRWDLSSARRLDESGKVLLDAARLNLRPVFDVSGAFSYSGLSEDSSITGGIAKAVRDWTGPSIRLGAVIEKPIGNRVQRGRYQQQMARSAQRAIAEADLERLIGANVVETVAAMEHVARRAQLADETVRYYNRVLDDEVTRFRLGDATLLDTIITEQRLTDASYALIDARYAYAVLLSRLLYETGSIVDADGDGFQVREVSLSSLPTIE